MRKLTGSSVCFGLALSGSLLSITAATADETYPPGTECANLRTIAERLLCGRQELKRGDAAVQQQQNVPPPPYDGYSPEPDQAQPPPPGTTPLPTPTTQPVSPQSVNPVQP